MPKGIPNGMPRRNRFGVIIPKDSFEAYMLDAGGEGTCEDIRLRLVKSVARPDGGRESTFPGYWWVPTRAGKAKRGDHNHFDNRRT